MAICTKQSIGVTLAVIAVGYKLLFVENKKQFKEYIKSAGARIIGILLPVVLMIIYLVVTNSLIDFINYAILGIKTFSNKISYVELLYDEKIEIRLLSILMPISIIINAVIFLFLKLRKKEEQETKNILTILIYSLSIIILMYPISDTIHFLIGSFIAIIGLAYQICLLGKILYKKINYTRKYKAYKIITLLIQVIILSGISIYGINNLYNYIKTEKNERIAHYKNIEINENLTNRIDKIDSYILEQENKGKKVYILDVEAAVYMIPINKYNKNYDMFLKGNIGKDGEQGVIEKIKKRNENELYLIKNSNLKINWQTPVNVVNYIRENLEKIGEVSIYEIYK